MYAPRAESALLLDVARAQGGWLAVGERGLILRSSDGMHWQQVPAPVDVTLVRLRFLDQLRGWALGYDGCVLATADGGAHWRVLRYDAAWGRPWFDVRFFDPAHGLLAGTNGALMATSDGGQTWQTIDSPVFADTPNLYNLIELGDGSLLIAGERGLLARSLDRGQSWSQLKSPYTGSYFGALPIGAKGVLVFGLRGNAFYAPDIAQVPPLTAAERAALSAAANDPEYATRNINPVSTVPGWVELQSDQTESLFGGSLAPDGRILLFGMNGHIMQADLSAARLWRLAISTDNNMNAGAIAGDWLLVVGSQGVQRLPLPR
jgi:photosystem II stability/assembly factor-like uncharacterized protein